MTVIATVRPDSAADTKRRFRILATSALCSAALVGALMQISAAIAADDDLSGFFTAGNDDVNFLTFVPYVTANGLVLNMQAGDDKATFGSPGFPFDAAYGGNATINGSRLRF